MSAASIVSLWFETNARRRDRSVALRRAGAGDDFVVLAAFAMLLTPCGSECAVAANVSDESGAHVASLFTQSLTALLADPDAPIGDPLPRSATPTPG